MDNSRDFDLDRDKEQMRLNVREKRHREEIGSETSQGQSEEDREQLHSDILELHRAYDIGSVSLNPNRRVGGRMLLAAARFVSGLLKPIIRRQSEYNAANARLTDYLRQRVDWLYPRFIEFCATTERIMAGRACASARSADSGDDDSPGLQRLLRRSIHPPEPVAGADWRAQVLLAAGPLTS